MHDNMSASFMKKLTGKERRREHVHEKEGTDPEYGMLSNAELPGMQNGWGVGMYVFTPVKICTVS